MAIESQYNPNAKNPGSSACGLGQILDKTAKDYDDTCKCTTSTLILIKDPDICKQVTAVVRIWILKAYYYIYGKKAKGKLTIKNICDDAVIAEIIGGYRGIPDPPYMAKAKACMNCLGSKIKTGTKCNKKLVCECANKAKPKWNFSK